jgi:hypothetical protein
MDGNDPAMLGALLGKAPVVKDFVSGPTATTPTSSTTTTTSAAGPAYRYSGVWNQSAVALSPTVLASLPDDGEGVPTGTLAGFASNDPAFSCLAAGGPLTVDELVGAPGVFLVTAQTPGDCATGWWTFTADSGPGGGAGGGGDGGTTTTTSTDPGSTTSTTTTTSTSTTTTTVPG